MEHTHEHGNTGGKLPLISQLRHLETKIASTLQDVPHLPDAWKKVITSVLPWITLIFGILALFGFVTSGMFSLLVSPLLLLAKGFSGLVLIINLVCGLLVAILALMSFKPLLAMKRSGWEYSFYGLAVGTISSLASILLLHFSIPDILVVLVGVYVLFEVRGKYN